MRRAIRLLAFTALLALSAISSASAQRPQRAGPPTPTTCFWTDREFKDLPERPPAQAEGIVLWNHGQVGNGQPGWGGGAPPVIRRFADRGWEVRLVQRNERCEGNWAKEGHAYVRNLLSEVAKARQQGYARVLVAGQSYGAGTALGAAAQAEQIDGVLAFALSHGRGQCRNPQSFLPSMIPLHTGYIRQGIAEAQAKRILISMGKDDHCIGHTFTPLVAEGLQAKNAAYIHFDEGMKFAGHSVALSREFNQTYGECIYNFFAGPSQPPKGRTICN